MKPGGAYLANRDHASRRNQSESGKHASHVNTEVLKFVGVCSNDEHSDVF